MVTAGANEAMFATFAGYLNDGDEVICIEPFFDQYIVSNSDSIISECLIVIISSPTLP